MSDDLSLDSISKEEMEEAKKVIYVECNNREGETISEAFVNRVEEVQAVGSTGYKREVVFPIPLELVKGDEDTRKFIETVGKISRDKNIGLPIKMEQEDTEGVEIINLVFEPTEDTKLDLIRKKLNK